MSMNYARRFRAIVDGVETEVVLAGDYDKLEDLCVDFTRAVGEALIVTNQRSPDSQSDQSASGGAQS
jgi:hypothetical protein